MWVGGGMGRPGLARAKVGSGTVKKVFPHPKDVRRAFFRPSTPEGRTRQVLVDGNGVRRPPPPATIPINPP